MKTYKSAQWVIVLIVVSINNAINLSHQAVHWIYPRKPRGREKGRSFSHSLAPLGLAGGSMYLLWWEWACGIWVCHQERPRQAVLYQPQVCISLGSIQGGEEVWQMLHPSQENPEGSGQGPRRGKERESQEGSMRSKLWHKQQEEEERGGGQRYAWLVRWDARGREEGRGREG